MCVRSESSSVAAALKDIAAQNNLITSCCGASFITLRFDRMLKFTPALIFIKIVFDVEKCLVSRQGLSRDTHFYCRSIAVFFLNVSCSKLWWLVICYVIMSHLQGRELKPFNCMQSQDHLWFIDFTSEIHAIYVRAFRMLAYVRNDRKIKFRMVSVQHFIKEARDVCSSRTNEKRANQ